MKKPDSVRGPVATARWMARQAWSDLKSIYYANTIVWRWLKSGALVFLGFCVWAGAAVLLSVRPGWTFLYLFMAYGFLLVLWGPLTHFGIVPLVLRVRRTASHPFVQRIARHAGKINLTIFFTLVVILAIVQPGIMLLEFSPPGTNGEEVRGDISCVGPENGEITCEVVNGAGFDHVVVVSNGDVLDRADEPPYELQFTTDEMSGTRYLVQLRDANDNVLRTQSESI